MRLLFLTLSALTLLAGCTHEPRPVRLDFIGSSRFTSANRTANPGDTLSTRLYGTVDTKEATLKHFQARVTYKPTRIPVIYPVSGAAPGADGDAPLLYIDEDLSASALREVVRQISFGTRTTSGFEEWEFTVTDNANPANSARRTFKLRVSRADSAAQFHQYTLFIPAAPAAQLRPYVALLPGLAFPASVPEAGLAGRNLIDLEYRPGTNALQLYQKPVTDPTTPTAQLQLTSIDSVAFGRLITPEAIRDVFGPARPTSPVSSTGPLVRNQVVGFRTIQNHAGAFIVRRIRQTPYPVIELQVKVSKTPE